MGQYWKIANTHSRERLDVFGKQMEICTQYSPMQLTACMLLQDSWHNQCVVLVGDCTSESLGASSANAAGRSARIDLYEAVGESFSPPRQFPRCYRSVMNKAERVAACDMFYAGQAIVDFTNKQYLRIGDYFKRETSSRDVGALIEHPVPLLLSAPGELGGGDYPYPGDFGYGLFYGHRVGLYDVDDNRLIAMQDITDRVRFDVSAGIKR